MLEGVKAKYKGRGKLMQYGRKKPLWIISIHLIMLIVVFVCLFPVVWSCIISIKSIGEKVSGFSALTIETPTLANYKRLLSWYLYGDNYGTAYLLH